MKSRPCEFDHNGECLICDCWIDSCAWDRFINKDYKYENKEQLSKLFLEYLRDRNLEDLTKD